MSDTITWAERVKAHKDAGGDMSLASLLELAKKHTMTAEEREAQRRSWVIGELMLDDPTLTREQANALYDRVGLT